MTTHYQKIQALGNRMASNLETMGVSASFNDGGLTLADKILQIQRFNDGIILYGDKIIAQSADTVNLYALLLDDKIPQSGETVKFYADKILVTDTASPGDSLYDDYYVTSEKTGSSWDYIGSGSTGFIQFNSEKINTYHSSWSGEVSHNGDKIHIKDGVLTYHDTSDVEQTIDVSAIDTTKAYNTAAFTVYYYWVEATTGSNGVANYQYTCTGAGKINFSAKSGSSQSEIYAITDAIFYDDGVSGTNTKWDCLFITKSLESNGLKFLCNTTSASARATMNPYDDSTVHDFDAQPMVFECYLADLYIPSNAIGMQFLQTGSNPNKQMNFSTQDIGHTIKVVYDETSLIKYRDNVEVSRTSVTYTDKIRVGFSFYSVDGYIIVRDVKAYPI